MHVVTISERTRQNNKDETVVDGFNVAIEPPVTLTDDEIQQAFGPDRNHLPNSPHTFTEIGKISLTGTDTSFSIGRSEGDYGGLFYGRQGSPLSDGATWVVSSILADLLGSKGLEFKINDPREPSSPSYADLPQPWVTG